MKSDKKPIIGLICVMLCCIFVIGITIGLLSSVNNTATADSTADTTDSAKDTTEEPPEIEPAPELEWGYKFKNFDGFIDGGWIGSVAYKSKECSSNIDEVGLTISFGSFLSKYGQSESYDVPEYEIYFAVPLGSLKERICTLKKVEDQFFSEKYSIAYVKDESEDWDYHYEFSHTEEITIPKELFTENEGIVRIVIGGTNIAENSHYTTDYLILGEAEIKYQKQGNDKVVLSKPYEDEWYY